MNDEKRGKVLDCFPPMVLGAYWLYKGLICAVLTHDPRLLKLSLVSAPVVLAVLYAIFKIAARKSADTSQ